MTNLKTFLDKLILCQTGDFQDIKINGHILSFPGDMKAGGPVTSGLTSPDGSPASSESPISSGGVDLSLPGISSQSVKSNEVSIDDQTEVKSKT